jgi:hypothetical protein
MVVLVCGHTCGCVFCVFGTLFALRLRFGRVLVGCGFGVCFWFCLSPPVALAPLSGAFLGVYVVTGLAGLCEILFGRFLWVLR